MRAEVARCANRKQGVEGENIHILFIVRHSLECFFHFFLLFLHFLRWCALLPQPDCQLSMIVGRDAVRVQYIAIVRNGGRPIRICNMELSYLLNVHIFRAAKNVLLESGH